MTDGNKKEEQKMKTPEEYLKDLPFQMEPDMIRIGNTIAGISKSMVNVVMFRDAVDLWLQYYIGLYFKKPTIVVIKHKDKKRFMKRLNDPLVEKVIDVTEFTDPTVERVAQEIQAFIERKKMGL